MRALLDSRSSNTPLNRAACAVASGLIAAATLWGPMPAASALTQDALCQGARSCGLSLASPHGGSGLGSLQVVDSGQRYKVAVTGNAGVDVEVQFYAVEFNSQGRITALVPAGESVTVTAGGSAEIIPRSVGGQASGWGFVGLADDTSIDLRSRVGELYEFSGLTLKTLGDGYADLKPVGTDLEMWTLGNIRGVGYWVEYLDVDGQWKEVPGQGYGSPARLSTTPGEISSLTYQVPPELEAGRAYTFRINSHTNYSRPGVFLRAAQFAEWTVIPAEGTQGDTAPRGNQLDPGAAPGRPDATGEPTPSGPGTDPEPGPVPSVAPTSTPNDAPSQGGGNGGNTSGPSKESEPPRGKAPAVPNDSTLPETSAPDDSAVPTPSMPATPSPATPSPSTGPSNGGPSQAPTSAPGPVTTADATPVWGDEKFGATASATRVEPQTSWLLAVGLAGVVLGPVGWFAVTRWRASRALQEES